VPSGMWLEFSWRDLRQREGILLLKGVQNRFRVDKAGS
jgi:hypothetical protein